MSRDILSLLEAGYMAQIEKLRENEHKKGFDDCNLKYVYRRLMGETDELIEELFKENIDYKATRREFADIANFCHMGIFTCDKKIKEEEWG